MDSLSSVFSQLFSQFGYESFSHVLIFSLIIGLLIILTAFPFSLYAIKKLEGRRLILFALGLFLLFSFSPVLKVLVVRNLFEMLPPYLKLVILYTIHLLPLYSLIFLFMFSFISKEIFNFTTCHNIKFLLLLKHFIKKMWMTIFTFWNFAIVYIIFDTSKRLIDSSLFSFKTIQDAIPSNIFPDIPPFCLDLINVIPIVILLLPAIFFLYKSPPIIFGNTEINQSIFNPSLKFLSQALTNAKKININVFMIVFLPIAIYIVLIFFTFDLKSLELFKIGGVVLSCMIVSVVIIYLSLFAFYSFVKKFMRKFCIPLLFIFALIPGEIIGYLINYVGISPDMKMSLGFFLFYGVFPLFFLNMSTLQSDDAVSLSKNYRIRGARKVRVIQMLNSSGIILSIMFFAILTCNDSSITSSLVIPNMSEKSIAFALSDAMKSNFQNIGTLPTQLILTNLSLIVLTPLAPFVFGLFFPINLSKNLKF